MDAQRKERVAKNEALFRAMNETIDRMSGDQDLADRYEFVCECGDETCFKTLTLDAPTYRKVRADAARFMVIAGHEIPEVEVVIERREGYLIVEKIGAERKIVREMDPRAD